MAIYVFNLLVNYLPNGVDNSQGYRASMLKNFMNPIIHIFTEVPSKKKIDLYQKVGIDVGRMLNIHQYFTDNHTLEISAKVKDKIQALEKSLNCTRVERGENRIRFLKDGFLLADILLDDNNRNCFYAIHYFSRGKLIRSEHYTDKLLYVNYYITAKEGEEVYAKLVRRTFHNRDGSVAFDQIFESGKEWYIFPDGRRYTESGLIGEFIKKLNLTKKDTVLIDRSAQQDFVQPLFQFGREARFITIFHSGHFFGKGEEPSMLYLNYEYYYWFKYAEDINVMVVSTQEQKEELEKKLQEYRCNVPDIAVIPAGGIDYLRYPIKKRRPCSLVAVSRLTRRKRVDWLIKSVVKAHRINPEISLDIYGEDEGCLKDLQDMVSFYNAGSYIRFMGYRNVAEVYKDYEVFVTASLWETLGLSVMEAIGSGLAVIGLDVKYGNRLFIRPEENGYLIDFDVQCVDGDDSELVNCFSEKIVEIFRDEERLKKFHDNSYGIGKEFLQEIIRKKWEKLLLNE